MKKLVAIIAAAICAACAAPDNRARVEHLTNKDIIPNDSMLFVKIAGDTQVKFLGYTDFDDAGAKGGQIMYPGGNAGVFLVSVLTHSATVSSIKNSEKQHLQDKADEVLLPYRSSINEITTDKLIDSSVKTGLQDGELQLTYFEPEKQQSGWIIESSPVFFITQDQSSIVLQNPVIIYEKGNPAKPYYRNLVEIVFQLPNDQKATSYLNADGQLTQISSSLFNSSLKLSIQDAQHQLTQDGTDKTFSYYLGKEKVFERGKIAHMDCERLTIRTLHGWLKSVPVPAESNSEYVNCANANNEQHAPNKI